MHSSHVCFALALVTVSLLGPLSLLLRDVPKTSNVAPLTFRPPHMGATARDKRHTGGGLPASLTYAYLIPDLLESEEPERVKELLDPVLPELVTMVWVNREKFSHTRLVLEDWWSKNPLGVRSIYGLGGLEPPALVAWLKEKEQMMGRNLFTVVEDTSLLPPFATVNLAVEEVTTPYFVIIHADTMLEPLTLHYFLRRALLNPDAAVVDPIIWERHVDQDELILHSTYELLSASRTQAHSRLVPYYIRLPREHGTIPFNDQASIRDLSRKYISTQPLTAMGVEYHCALFETEVARHSFKILDSYATENPLNTGFVAAELNRNIMVEPQAIASYIYPKEGHAFEQEDVFMMAWAWDAEMAFINNCYAESKFGHVAESPRIHFWMNMVGYRMRGAHYGWNAPEPVHPDPMVQSQMIIGIFLIIGSNRFRFDDAPGGTWLEPRQFHMKAKAAAEQSKPLLMAFTQENELPIPEWNGPKLTKWEQRIALHESLSDNHHQGFVLKKEARAEVQGYNCSHQVYREHHLLRLDFAGRGAQPEKLACVSSLSSRITNAAFLILALPSDIHHSKFKIELWFEFPSLDAAHHFQETLVPEAHLGAKHCEFMKADSKPTSILLPTASNGVHVLQWKHDIDYAQYFEKLIRNIIYPHQSK
ncbi:hypothetical protein QOT17_002189 [Balamuthia mandrillaris]